MGAFWGASWGHLGATLGLKGLLRGSWGHLGVSWDVLGATWGRLGADLGASWAIVYVLGGVWEPLGGLLVVSWGILGGSWGFCGALGGARQASFTSKSNDRKKRCKNSSQTLNISLLGPSLEPLKGLVRGLLGAPWGSYGGSCGHLGTSWGRTSAPNGGPKRGQQTLSKN